MGGAVVAVPLLADVDAAAAPVPFPPWKDWNQPRSRLGLMLADSA